MQISQHLDTIACPLCKGMLNAAAENSKLICCRCRLSFPVKEGIPLLLTDAAEKTEDECAG